ncbi:MAG TPA: DUF4010 domain-containing protein, partial [Gemmatimonadales bacterium]|nr:DUF4010 domain-containing protein [Gemmatimonadales bacterium]
SREEPQHSPALAAGTIAACTVVLARVVVVLLVLNAALAPRVGMGLAPMFAVGVVLIWLGHRREPDDKPRQPAGESKNPLRLGSAIFMALAFQVVLMILHFFQEQFGDSGILASAALAGLTDLDAITFGMSQLAENTAMISVASQALILATVVNTVVKTAVALVLGSPAYRRLAVPGLFVVALAGAAGFFLAGRLI